MFVAKANMLSSLMPARLQQLRQQQVKQSPLTTPQTPQPRHLQRK
mgnify:CR=1 FL=1